MQKLFKPGDYPELLVGLSSPDDAAVWKLDEQRSLVLTTDFFTPVVDDPRDYGRIAAANSLSDIYAMGGTPFLALNIAALPPDLPAEVSTAILMGGAEVAKQAGVVIAGGHTVQDKEPKYGLVVAGFVENDRYFSKAGARPGDILYLTKPLGFGVVTTALKQDKADQDDVSDVVGWMTTLNRDASLAARESGVRSATDITGFGFLGHAQEMAVASQVGLQFEFKRIPMLYAAQSYARNGIFPGGAFDNMRYYISHIDFQVELQEHLRLMLFDPQTSGGLLIAVPPQSAGTFENAMRSRGSQFWQVGKVVPGEGISIT